MAPWYYRLLHPDARLSETQRESLVRWAKQKRASATASAH